jgi:hypothetical protein
VRGHGRAERVERDRPSLIIPSLEFEQLVKVHFADSGSRADIVADLDAARTWVLEQNAENLAAVRAYLAGEGAFPCAWRSSG